MERVRTRTFGIVVAFGLLAAAAVAFGAMDAGAANRPGMPGYASSRMPYMQVFPALIPGDKENTNVVAQNDGTAPATIAMDFYTPAGVLITGASIVVPNVPVGGSHTFDQVSNNGLVPGFRGVGVVSSDQPILALLVRGLASPSGLNSSSIHNATGTGANKLALPYVVNALDGLYNTRIAIANTGNTTACVTVEYAFKPGAGSTPAGGKANVVDSGPGGSGCATGYPVPVNGQVSFAPTAIDGAIPMPAGTANAQMSATVTSTGAPVTAAVDAWVVGKHSLGSYDGFVVGTGGDLGTNVVIPLAIKHPDGFLSQFLVANPNPAAANVTINYVGTNVAAGNAPVNVSVNLSVAANGTNDHGVYSDNVVPVGFVGAAKVTSDQPVAVVAFFGKMTTANSFIAEDTYAAINGVPAEKAGTSAKFPLAFRRAYGDNAQCSGSGTTCGYNSWISVTVADGGTANVTFKAVNDPNSTAPGCQGSNYTSTVTKQVTGSFIFYQNLDTATDNGFSPSPGCFWGGVVITSDKPIVAIGDVANDLNPGDTDGRYNAFSSN